MFDQNNNPQPTTSGMDDLFQNGQPAPSPAPAPAPSYGSPVSPATPPTFGNPDPVAEPSNSTPSTDDLLSIKQDALQQLSPLVGHLDQSPEEKFRTTMMMIQASDDQSLLKSAYETAKQITDEKVRAQALLDVVNEINYFTQHPHS